MTGDVDAQGTQDQDIVDHLNDAMMEELVPKLMSVREEYFVIPTRLTVTSSTVRVPERAIGNKFRIVAWRDSSGSNWGLPRIAPPQKYPAENITGVSEPSGYYLQGNNIKLVPGGISGTLEVDYFFRPGQLVKLEEGRIISAVDTATGAITLGSDPPSTWTTADKLDIHSGKSGGEIRQFSLTMTDITGSIVTVSDTIDGSVFGTFLPVVGDYLCLEGEAVLPALPIECHPVLAQAGVVKLAESFGDTENVAIHQAKLNRMMENLGILVDSRVEGQPQKIVNRNSLWSVSSGA